VEINDDAAESMEKNFPGLHSPVLRQDLRELSTVEILRRSSARPDLLVGGPPCIAFSKSRFWLDYKREGRDPAAGLLQAYTSVLTEARPPADTALPARAPGFGTGGRGFCRATSTAPPARTRRRSPEPAAASALLSRLHHRGLEEP
jgi:C-5 cytosine-specific DNA methylase